MKKFFVDQSGDGEGYVYEADNVHINASFAVFTDSVGQAVLIEANFQSVELVTDEDVDYVDETHDTIQAVADALPHDAS